MRLLFLTGVFAGMLLAGFAFAGNTYVRDGDTIVVNGTPVRLKGLSCPELKEPGGQEAKQFLKDALAHTEEIRCQLTGERTYDREVGWCQLDGVDVGAVMIEYGGCQPCRRYDETGLYDKYPVTQPVPNYCKE